MKKVYLFSPVGGTDPVSNNNCQDGALIHICRVYKPDKVYMYMSQYILDCEAKDNRYTYCIDRLYEKLGSKADYEIIRRPDLVDVHEFDYFYDDYKKEISKILNEMDPDDQLLINTSSGTPAMKSALVVLVTLGDVDGTLIQVTTPEKRINKHDHDNYDVKGLWELNPDNEEGFVNRCKVIECPSLYQIKNEELLKTLINSYDYHSALKVIDSMPERYTRNYKPLVEYACKRIDLDYKGLCELERKYALPNFLPVKDDKVRPVLEYAFSLFIKQSTGNYADFIRGITPLILELFVMAVKGATGVNPYDVCNMDKKTNSYKWSEDKINNNPRTKDWLELLRKRFKEFKSDSYINSESLCWIIDAKADDEVKALVVSLRECEKKIRNIAAHQIKPITDEYVSRATGNDCGQIVEMMKELFKCSLSEIDESVWNSYKTMNDYIIGQIGTSSDESVLPR